MAKLSSAAKAAEVGGQTLEDNLVQRFLPGSSDLKLKDKILDTPKVDWKIHFNHVTEKIKDYETAKNTSKVNAKRTVNTQHCQRTWHKHSECFTLFSLGKALQQLGEVGSPSNKHLPERREGGNKANKVTSH